MKYEGVDIERGATSHIKSITIGLFYSFTKRASIFYIRRFLDTEYMFYSRKCLLRVSAFRNWENVNVNTSREY